jgi:hypothetical protein
MPDKTLDFSGILMMGWCWWATYRPAKTLDDAYAFVMEPLMGP